MLNNDYVNFKFVAATRCLIVESEQGEYLDYKFYGEYDENISYQVNCFMKEWLTKNKQVTSYSHDLHELEEVPDYHIIKVIFEDNDSLITRIRGTIKEVINHYRKNNYLAYGSDLENKQVKKIQFIESPILNNVSSYDYLFIDNSDNGLLA